MKTDREKYMDGEMSFQDYYTMIGREAGISYKNSSTLKEFKGGK